MKSMKFLNANLKLFAAVLLAALFTACSGGTKPANNGANQRPANTAPNAVNAPLGAQPPNMLGGATAAVVIEEFADFQCPTCAVIHNVMKNVQAAYGSRIKFIYRHYPLTQIHRNAYDAAVAAEAAGLQGKFWDMQNIIFQNQQAWSNSTEARAIFESYAERIGIDVERFKTDMLGFAAKQRVDADMQRGRALNVSSTPTILINGVQVPFEQMKIDSLRQIIDAELAKAPQSTPMPAASPTAAANANRPANANKPAAAANSKKPQTDQ